MEFAAVAERAGTPPILSSASSMYPTRACSSAVASRMRQMAITSRMIVSLAASRGPWCSCRSCWAHTRRRFSTAGCTAPQVSHTTGRMTSPTSLCGVYVAYLRAYAWAAAAPAVSAACAA